MENFFRNVLEHGKASKRVRRTNSKYSLISFYESGNSISSVFFIISLEAIPYSVTFLKKNSKRRTKKYSFSKLHSNSTYSFMWFSKGASKKGDS